MRQEQLTHGISQELEKLTGAEVEEISAKITKGNGVNSLNSFNMLP